MEYRPLGTSGLMVSPIIFGAWAIGGWYWGRSDDQVAEEAIHRALDLGVNCIDTAPMYGFGHSEEVVGRAIKSRRSQVILATKCGLRWDREGGKPFFPVRASGGKMLMVRNNLSRQSIFEECERSLKRLGVETIDLYQCHWPDPSTDLDETLEALSRLREQGKIRAIGVSNFSIEMMEQCLQRLPLASCQPRYNLLDRHIELNLLGFCQKRNLGVIVYSPLAQGLLTGKVTLDRSFSEGDLRPTRPWFSPQSRKRVLAALDRLRPLAARHQATLTQVILAWTLAVPGVTGAIVGIRDPRQAEENGNAAGVRLSEEEHGAIRMAFEARWPGE